MFYLLSCTAGLFYPLLLLGYYFKFKALPQMINYIKTSYLAYLLADYIFIFWCASLLRADIIEEDSFFVLVSIFPGLECLIIYMINKIAGPQVDARNIKKEPIKSNFSFSFIVTFLLFAFNPYFVIETYISACGFDDLSDFYDSVDNLSGYVDNNTLSEIQTFSSQLSLFILLYFAFIIALVVFFLKRMRREKTNIAISDINSKKAPILFLRSFELNKSAVSGVTLDEYLCKGFPIKDQPVISLADPDLEFTDGSIKMQAQDKTWKEAITTLFSSCKAVIMFEGKSDGLNWEIDNIRKYIDYNRFFIAIPPEDYRSSAWYSSGYFTHSASRIKIKIEQIFNRRGIEYAYNFIWKKFSDRLEMSGIHLPKEQPGCGCLISFTRDWKTNKIYKGLKGSNFFSKVMAL